MFNPVEKILGRKVDVSKNGRKRATYGYKLYENRGYPDGEALGKIPNKRPEDSGPAITKYGKGTKVHEFEEGFIGIGVSPRAARKVAEKAEAEYQKENWPIDARTGRTIHRKKYGKRYGK